MNVTFRRFAHSTIIGFLVNPRLSKRIMNWDMIVRLPIHYHEKRSKINKQRTKEMQQLTY